MKEWGDHEEAKHFLSKALQLDPCYMHAHNIKV
jgi:hypothetical protein